MSKEKLTTTNVKANLFTESCDGDINQFIIGSEEITKGNVVSFSSHKTLNYEKKFQFIRVSIEVGANILDSFSDTLKFVEEDSMELLEREIAEIFEKERENKPLNLSNKITGRYLTVSMGMTIPTANYSNEKFDFTLNVNIADDADFESAVIGLRNFMSDKMMKKIDEMNYKASGN